MKKNIYAAILLLTGAVMVACSGSDDITGNTTPEPQTPTVNGAVELKGTLGSKGDQTRSIDTNGNGSWEVGDKFAIYYTTDDGHSTAVATVNSINSNGSANFTATLSYPKTGSNNVTLVYPASAHDGQGGFKTDALMNQDGTLDYINANGLDIETASTTMNVEEKTATLNSDVTMQPQVCLYQMNLRGGTYLSPLTTTKLIIKENRYTYTITPTPPTSSLIVALLPVTGSGISITATTTEEATLYTKRDGITLTNCTAENVGDVFDEEGNIYSVSKGPGAIYSKMFYGKQLYAGRFYSGNVDLSKQATDIKGMIAYVGDHGTVDDSSTDTQTGFRGLAISMSSIPVQEKWCDRTDVDCTGDDSDNVTDATIACNTKNGISMTESLISHSGSNSHNHVAASLAHSTTGHPSSTSDWFLPSVGQWQLIFQGVVSKASGTSYTTPITTTLSTNNEINLFNSVLDQVGIDHYSNCYWLSTEYGSDKTWAVATKGYAFANTKTWDSYVRKVLAF